MNRIVGAARAAVHEVTHLRRIRTAVLCAELRARGVPYRRGGDAVTVLIDQLWYDLYAWTRDDGLVWVVDHPHADPDDEHPGHEIGRLKGFRVHLDQVFHLWFRYREPSYPPWLTYEHR
ncbi:hypothetical protein [Nocardia brasiliensis]|uniref:hypothetical protein n=1 Tax=Nocardia brasiliensis TaxID=37326 RepID=UPI0018960C10|nr:hypothetical protein [Nocardia brasiliensis]MBF6548887.1 hypothetical protein [Nocardia brasiliensis]